MDIDEFTYEDEQNEDNSLASSAVPMSIYAVLMYLGLCTNIWMLWSLYKTWKAGSRVQFYLLALSLTDVLVLCTQWPNTGEWTSGDVGCKLTVALKVSTPMLAHLLLAGFNIDNLVTILCRRSSQLIRIVVLFLAVLASIACCIQTMTIARKEVHEEKGFCVVHASPALMRLHEYGSVVGIYMFPLFIIFIFGVISLVILYYHDTDCHDRDQSGEVDVDNIGVCIRKVAAFNVLFFVCWTPFALLRLLFVFYPVIYHHQYLLIIYLVIHFVSILYSLFLPVINGVFNCLSENHGDTLTSPLEEQPHYIHPEKEMTPLMP